MEIAILVGLLSSKARRLKEKEQMRVEDDAHREERERFVGAVKKTLPYGELVLESCGSGPCCAVTAERVFIQDRTGMLKTRDAEIKMFSFKISEIKKVKKGADYGKICLHDGREFVIGNETIQYDLFIEEVKARMKL